MEQSQPSTRGIRTVKLWIKAFIPSTYENAKVVPGEGEHAGKTMLNSLWLINRCFLTDQRSFSSDIHAEARMHSEIEIDFAKGKETYQFHHCYDTIEIDCKNGKEKCRGQGSTDRMNFHDVAFSEDKNVCTMTIKAGSRNPCLRVARIKVTPSLDYMGEITITRTDDPSRAIVTFNGKIEKYPAFEMYAVANDGDVKTVFQVDVAPSATIGDLPGGPAREVYGRAEICTRIASAAEN